MQAWSRRTECIFCSYDNILARTIPRPKYRSYHSTQVLNRDRPGERRKENVNKQAGITPSLKHRIEGNTSESPKKGKKELLIRRYAGRSADEATIQFQLEQRLRTTRDLLLHNGSRELPQQLQYLKKVDADGQAWKVFERMLTDIMASDGGTVPRKQSGLVGRLRQAASSRNWQADLDREIHFGFLDHILSSGESTHRDVLPEADLRYPTEWYGAARILQRKIHLHVGPTNSGKTYNALKKLEESESGFYAGPLRLLAHEVYSRFNNRGIACDLVTGDDVRLDDSKEVQLYASTVEMVNVSKACDVGVIDEIQMISSEDRGWAWTRAVLGAQARELHLCGEARVVPLIREIVASMGDTLHVHQYERLNPLKVMSRSLKGNLNNLRKGDCVVSFSVMNIHALKKQIELDTGRRVAIVYGSLPPETRAQQAALFNDPDNDYDYLVASDAIGMGLNLSIKRVIFETTMKYNGTMPVRLSIPQIKQIAGRAGRFRTARDDTKQGTEADTSNYKTTASVGLVTCLDDADLPAIRHALTTEAPPLRTAGLLPPGEVYEEFASRLPLGTPFEYVLQRVMTSVSLNPRYKLCDIEDQTRVARLLDRVPDLSIDTRLVFAAAPAQLKGKGFRHDDVLLALARAVVANRPVSIADIQEIPLEVLDEPMSPQREYLEALEGLHKTLILYLWLSYRLPHILLDQDMAVHAKNMTEEKINQTLTNYSANPKLRARLLQIKKASAMLREQTRDRGSALQNEKDIFKPTMNPDARVEEVERLAAEEDIKAKQQIDGDASRTNVLEDQTALNLGWGRDTGKKEGVQQHTQPDDMAVTNKEVGPSSPT